MLKALREKGYLTLRDETRYLCKQIKRNFRIVPFDKDNLNSCVNDLIIKHSESGKKIPTKDDFLSDKDMGTLLRQFSDTSFNEQGLANIAIDWWLSLLNAAAVKSGRRRVLNAGPRRWSRPPCVRAIDHLHRAWRPAPS